MGFISAPHLAYGVSVKGLNKRISATNKKISAARTMKEKIKLVDSLKKKISSIKFKKHGKTSSYVTGLQLAYDSLDSQLLAKKTMRGDTG